MVNMIGLYGKIYTSINPVMNNMMKFDQSRER